MNRSMHEKLEQIDERHTEVGQLMSDPATIADQPTFQSLAKEYAKLEPLVQTFADYRKTSAALDDALEMAAEDDPELKQMAEEEAQTAQRRKQLLEKRLQLLLLPTDPNDERGVFLEVRAGTGGDEAALFAGDLFRMYARYAESQGWRIEVMSEHSGEHGGFKLVIARLDGDNVYSALKFESGAHRVQRVPETESQGRIHTSACTVAVLPQVDEVEEVDVNPGDLRIDTYRSSGAGGQHVNTTDSAIRITHLPSGIVVECQDERSQHKNKARAMSLLSAKLLETERQRQNDEQAESRRLQVGSGDRSQRIRTYNFPQGRVTDHRINLTLYKLDEVLQGGLDAFVKPLTQEHQADQLAQISN